MAHRLPVVRQWVGFSRSRTTYLINEILSKSYLLRNEKYLKCLYTSSSTLGEKNKRRLEKRNESFRKFWVRLRNIPRQSIIDPNPNFSMVSSRHHHICLPYLLPNTNIYYPSITRYSLPEDGPCFLPTFDPYCVPWRSFTSMAVRTCLHRSWGKQTKTITDSHILSPVTSQQPLSLSQFIYLSLCLSISFSLTLTPSLQRALRTPNIHLDGTVYLPVLSLTHSLTPSSLTTLTTPTSHSLTLSCLSPPLLQKIGSLGIPVEAGDRFIQRRVLVRPGLLCLSLLVNKCCGPDWYFRQRSSWS